MATNYQEPSDLSEKQIEADVASFFGYMSPFFGKRLRLIDVNEQLTGADKATYTKGRVYYFQFKKPIGLLSATSMKIPLMPRKNESKLMKIRRFRELHALGDFPHSICFPLHGDKTTPINELQHNVLFEYEKPELSRAMYICPTVLKIEDYEKALSRPFWTRIWGSPYSESRRQTVYGLAACSEVWRCPFLRGHVTVVPHTKVTSPDHYYSFTKNGTDIAFHSPEIVAGGPERLSDFLHEELRQFITNFEELPTLFDVASAVFKISQPILGGETEAPNGENYLEWLQSHGRVLLEKHSIRQFIIAANFELLQKDKENSYSV